MLHEPRSTHARIASQIRYRSSRTSLSPRHDSSLATITPLIGRPDSYARVSSSDAEPQPSSLADPAHPVVHGVGVDGLGFFALAAEEHRLVTAVAATGRTERGEQFDAYGAGVLKARAAFIGPAVCELDGPMPTLNRSKTLIATWRSFRGSEFLIAHRVAHNGTAGNPSAVLFDALTRPERRPQTYVASIAIRFAIRTEVS